MKTTVYLSLLALPILLQGVQASSGLPAALRKAGDLKRLNAFCSVSPEKKAELSAQATKIGKGKAVTVSSAVLEDLKAVDSSCTKESREAEVKTLQEIAALDPQIPLDIFANYSGHDDLFKNDADALAYVNSKEANDCAQIKFQQRYDRDVWHNTFLNSGWKCIAENAITLAQTFNESTNHASAQSKLEQLNKLTLPELKELFKKKYAANPFKLGFVPQLSWENGVLNTTFPYSLLTSPTELTSYRMLIKEFRKLGVKAVLVNRNSMDKLSSQVIETSEQLKKLDGKHVIISRSMGARVMREVLVNNDAEVISKIRTVLNVGGTPHGSVIASAKSRPDSFYLDTFKAILDGMKLPINVIALDPRIPDHIKATLYSAIDRRNLETMSPVEPRLISESAVKVLNAQFVRSDHVRATTGVDPVWLDMIMQGPTEGSAPIHGSTIDTPNAIRTILPGDHLEFWKLTPKEALAVYLRLLILSDEEGLI